MTCYPTEKWSAFRFRRSMSDDVYPFPINTESFFITSFGTHSFLHFASLVAQSSSCLYNHMDNIQLEYDQTSVPPHQLKVHEHSHLKLHQLQGRKLSSDVMSIKYDREGEYLALGSKNGTRILYSTAEEKYVARHDDARDNAVTSLKWRPTAQGKSKILATVDAGGFITFHHIPSLKPLFTLSEADNSIHTIDYSPLGRHFATGGKDFHIRIYDEDTKSMTADMKPAGWNNVGHDNRVFAVHFIDENTLISGGWDSVVHLWDIRQGKSMRHFYGPNISGESLDYQNGYILAGCYAATRQLQIYDFTSFKKVQEIDWSGQIDDAEYLYCAAFNRRDPTYFAAGATGPNSEVRLYRQTEEGPTKHEMTTSIKGLNQGCFSLDFSCKLNQFAFSTPYHGFYVYQYQNTSE